MQNWILTRGTVAMYYLHKRFTLRFVIYICMVGIRMTLPCVSRVRTLFRDFIRDDPHTLWIRVHAHHSVKCLSIVLDRVLQVGNSGTAVKRHNILDSWFCTKQQEWINGSISRNRVFQDQNLCDLTLTIWLNFKPHFHFPLPVNPLTSSLSPDFSLRGFAVWFDVSVVVFFTGVL